MPQLTPVSDLIMSLLVDNNLKTNHDLSLSDNCLFPFLDLSLLGEVGCYLWNYRSLIVQTPETL